MAKTREYLLSKMEVTVILAALTLALAAPRLASADSITTWSVNVYATAHAGGNAQQNFTPVGGVESYGSNFQISNIPAGTQQTNYGGSSATLDTVPTTPSLTSATLGIAATNSTIPAGSVFANSNAYANLATGSMGVSGSTNLAGVTGGTSSSEAWMQDLLTFNIPGATSSTVTDIGVQWEIDGSLSSTGAGIGSSAEMEGHLYFTGGAGSPLADAGTAWSSDLGVLSNGLGTGTGGNWASSTVVSNTPNSIIIDGELPLTGQNPTLPLQLGLTCGVVDTASCDYYNTESIAFTLPAGVTFTSASGAFLTAQPSGPTPTPEPGSFLLFGAGAALLMLGCALRRRRSLTSS
ncbi:MAG: PEP-CTERM sorting domain-containing protein [Terriglobia bacterium]